MSDFRFACRTIASHGWFSAAIVATLALGIGINATVFTLANTVLYKPLPFPNGRRIVVVVSTQPAQDQARLPMSYPDFLDLRAQASSFERLEAVATGSGVLSETTVPAERVDLARVSAGLFAVAGVAPMLGRTLAPADERPDAPLAVVIGEDLWRSRYHGDPGVLGRVVHVDEASGTIVGVMPRLFSLPNNQKAWLPLRPEGRERDARDHRYLTVIGLLARRATIAVAARDAAAVAERLASAYPEADRQIRADVVTFNQRFNGNRIRTVFRLMFGAVALVLLVACANVANMMLGAALRRHREMALRTALGASRWRIIRQLLVESVMLSLLGGMVGLAIALAGVQAFNAAVTPESTGKPAWIVFSVDYRVIGYLAVICIACGTLFGLAPALRSSRVDVNAALKEGGRTGSGRSTLLSDVLVVVQFAMAAVLLTASGLMLRSVVAGQSFNPSVPRTQILSAAVQLPASRYPDQASRLRFFEDVLPRVAALPGVTQAALTTDLPGMNSGRPRFELEGHLVDKAAERPTAFTVAVSNGYFPLVGLRIVQGRTFEALEGDAGREAAIVSRAFAAAYWPAADAVGRRLRFHGDGAPGAWMTVVGVSDNLVQSPNDLAGGGATQPVIFTPYRSADATSMAVAVRTAGDAAALTNTLRATMQRADAQLPLSSLRTLDADLSRQLWPYRVFGTLFFVFAMAALTMAGVGLYAVMAQATTRRSKEIGIRVALGATPGRVLRTVMRRGLVQLAVGLALGLGTAFAATGAMRALLLGVEPTDLPTFAATAIVLLMTGLIACWLPARRAATAPPMRTLGR